MSSPLAISVRSVGKTYRISSGIEQHSTLAETALHRLKNPLARAKFEQFEALRDISFEVNCGDVVGIIGRNGAGKSTLLKVLSQITEPTSGEIALYGRVGSLLEVGTGFHPELTGRENIFLNGSILGMSKREIQAEFDNIVEFAGVAKFLDTPVKRYSSGMYVRLAFAVAAHLRTEILVVDEVLAVGDAEFQRKCLGKMRDVATDGRTVLFVSHHMQSVGALCSRAIYLQKGQLVFDGSVSRAIEYYIESFSKSITDVSNSAHRFGSGQLRFTNVQPAKDSFSSAEPKEFVFRIEKQYGDTQNFFLSFVLTDERGVEICNSDSRFCNQWFEINGDVFEGRFAVSNLWLKPGMYHITAVICNMGILDSVEGACSFEVLPLSPYPSPENEEASGRGLLYVDFGYAREGEPMQFASELKKLADQPIAL